MVRYHLYGTKIRLSNLPERTDIWFLILLIHNLSGLVTAQKEYMLTSKNLLQGEKSNIKKIEANNQLELK